MSKNNVIKIVKNIAESIGNDLGYELVDVEFKKEGSIYFLRVYIHKPGGVTIDDCQAMSQSLSRKLDDEDPITVPYYLEVSSPGLDRPLKTDKDLNRNLGKEIEIKLYEAMEGKKTLLGVLKGFTRDEITVQTSSQESLTIPRRIIALIKLAIKF